MAEGRISAGQGLAPSSQATSVVAIARLSPGWIVVTIGAAAAFVWFAAILIDQSLRLQSRGFDQGFFENVTWNIGHGGGFATALVPGNALAVHFSPILVVPAVLQLVWSDALVLSAINSAALAAAGPAAYVFFRALWPSTQTARVLAAALAVVLPFAPFMQLADQANFHPDSIALPLALLAAAAGLGGRRRTMWVLAAVVLLVKEDQAYAIAVIGLLIWRMRGPLASDGRVLALASCIWGAAVFFVVIPLLGQGTPSAGSARLVADTYYSWLTHASPAMILAALSTPETWGRLGLLILGLAGLPLLRPAWLALLAPPFLATLLSAHHAQALLHNHYGLVLAVPAVVAAGVGARRLLDIPGERWRRWAASAAVPGLACAVLMGSAPPLGQHPNAHPTSALAGLRGCLTGVPGDAPFAADDNLIAPLATRPRIQMIDQAQPTDYVAVDTAATPPGWVNIAERDRLLGTLSTNRSLICSSGSTSIWSPVHM